MATWTDLTFTKLWTNPVDFPTYEDDETQVRADYQLLHDEVKSFINSTLKAYIIAAINDAETTGVGDNAVTKAKMNTNFLSSGDITSSSTNDTISTTKAIYDFVVAYVEEHAPSGGGWLAQATAPTDTTVLWIDTSGSSGGLKYYDSTSATWVHCPVAYTESEE